MLPCDFSRFFHPAVANWFSGHFDEPTRAQAEAWPAIKAGRHTLIAAPTGSGKTLAAFLTAIDDLVREGVEGRLTDETRIVYVSPLKALSNDVDRNLEMPLAGIRAELRRIGLPDVDIRTWVRTGDTSSAERERMRRRPPHIVVTTPESLYVLLGSESGRRMLATTRSVIVDEIHAVAPNKRGAHLSVSLERLDALCGNRLLRIGLSAGGPYKVGSYQANHSITLEAARKDPLLGCPTYDRIVIRDIPETGTRMDQLRTGQLDIILGSRDLIDEAKRVGASVLTRLDANVIGLYIFQTYLPNNVFRDERVRQAAAYAIDHNLLEQTIWGNIGVRDWGCTWPPPTEISSENPRYIQACGKPYPYDPAKAKSLLEAAGYPLGNGPTIRLEYSDSYSEEAALAQAMQPMLDAVGFHTVIAHVDIATRNRERHHDGCANTLLFFGPGGRVTALAGAYSVWGPKQDWGPKDDKDVVAALDRASGADTLEEYTDAMADLGRLVHDRAYGPGFFSAGAIFFVRKGIPDWGMEKGKGRGLFNLAALTTHL